MKWTVTAILILLFCVPLVTAAGAPADFRPAVEKEGKAFAAAIDAKDSAAVGALYAQDAIAFPPNSDMVKGREAITAYWKGVTDQGMKAVIEIVETDGEGNLGFEVGKYTIMDPAGKTVDQGKYVVVWKKGKDGWKLYRDIWNTNMPAAAPAAK